MRPRYTVQYVIRQGYMCITGKVIIKTASNYVPRDGLYLKL